MKLAKLAALFFTCLLIIVPVAASAQPYVISSDSTEVTDQKTGLIWRRCSEGMKWKGTTCVGLAGTFTYEEALQRAATQASSTGVAWRLPTKEELSSIADKSLGKPAIDTKAFPATPGHWFWSSSPHSHFSTYAMGVNFGNGFVNFNFRKVGNRVRLVRAGK